MGFLGYGLNDRSSISGGGSDGIFLGYGLNDRSSFPDGGSDGIFFIFTTAVSVPTLGLTQSAIL